MIKYLIRRLGSSKMEVCSVLRAESRANFHFKIWGKTRNINRIDSDPLEKLAHRISCILEKDLKRQQPAKKKRNEDGTAEKSPSKVPTTLLKSFGKDLDLETTSIDDALRLKDLTLHVGETSFRCIVNPPRIKELAITPKPMVNFNAFVDCKALDAKNGVVFKWYAGEMNESAEMEKDPLVLDTIRAGVDLTCTKKGVQKPTYFRLIGESRENRLKIEKDLEGKILVCLACPVVGEGDPSISGSPLKAAATSKLPVSAGPGLCPYQTRQEEETQRRYYEKSTDKFRVVSYNILSDGLAETEFSKDGLFPYCPDEFVSWNHRSHLLLDEIIGYNADIVCLQELDSKMFRGEFYKTLETEGFEGVFSNKSASPEGTCALWRKKSFEKVRFSEYPINGALLDKDEKLFDDLRGVVMKCKPVKKAPDGKESEKEKGNQKSGQLILQLPHVLQVVTLKNKATGKTLLLCNTHLFWHPRGSNTRALQAMVISRLIKREQELLEKETGEPVPVVFCGDFNSVPERTAVRYLTGATVYPNDLDFFTSGKDGILRFEKEVSSPIVFEHGVRPLPKYSNYVAPFIGLLDYILINNLDYVESCKDFKHEDVTKHSGIPSKVFPSDHLAQVSVLKFR